MGTEKVIKLKRVPVEWRHAGELGNPTKTAAVSQRPVQRSREMALTPLQENYSSRKEEPLPSSGTILNRETF